jgi:hypothetical protein
MLLRERADGIREYVHQMSRNAILMNIISSALDEARSSRHLSVQLHRLPW